MSVGEAQVPSAFSPGDSSVAAAEDAVRALWSSLNRLEYSLTYLLPENCQDALLGAFAACYAETSVDLRQAWKMFVASCMQLSKVRRL